MRDVKLSPASIESASAGGKHPSLRSLPAGTESHCQEQVSTRRIVTTHAFLTGSAAGEMRERTPRQPIFCSGRARR